MSILKSKRTKTEIADERYQKAVNTENLNLLGQIKKLAEENAALKEQISLQEKRLEEGNSHKLEKALSSIRQLKKALRYALLSWQSILHLKPEALVKQHKDREIIEELLSHCPDEN